MEKRINSRDKGSKFERVVAKMLSEGYGVEFHRTPLSGGLHWKEANGVSGDIVPPDTISFPYNIECKNVETDWDFDKIIEGTSKFWDFWEQASKDARENEKITVVIFKKNRKDIYIAISEGILPLDAMEKHNRMVVYRKNKHIMITKFTPEIIKLMASR